ncbi:hypothetical protein AB4Z29_00335 [Paenibacillus sp. 2TAB23]|uniref:hypothetical protein n=1 Tax=Paenibacillus sp. 2TAB23 TaxID=3233004 RepID=UPI003F9C6133
MAQVIAPNREYTGLSAGVMFMNGVGQTDDPHLLEWFAEKGYEVEQVAQEEDKAAETAKKEAEKQLKALRKKATELGIEGVADKDANTLTAEITAAEQN